MTPQTVLMVLKLIDMVSVGLTAMPDLLAKYQQAKTKVETMIREGREPTEAEWNELFGEVAANSAELQAPDPTVAG